VKVRRLIGEVQSLQSQLASLQADRTILQNRLADRERYLQAIEVSLGWRVIERIRNAVGRGWK
jgi:prefoldin subunit 5